MKRGVSVRRKIWLSAAVGENRCDEVDDLPIAVTSRINPLIRGDWGSSRGVLAAKTLEAKHDGNVSNRFFKDNCG